MIALNKKAFITLGLTSLVVFGAVASMPQEQEKKMNLKVLPKKFTHQQVETVMRQWTKALGVRCNFCHERGNEAADTKPEKLMARKMFEMTAKINKKYFEAGKDSLGMVMNTGISCITCHHGTAHPEGGTHTEGGEKK
ncbi:c-type cytochrome [Mucilaginibacter mali]|uniref:Photosynthetic reaction center cytochrome c subunit n=1 Tax=Mucilaginibacter mali TaxID=2740462 RepID=A0A7D4Q6T6_9SPHI|nr:c-type cytochrome [Mucilaginibacter mali]QKJ29531.1 c-type cytochrome [Mucilaginibacter mali]